LAGEGYAARRHLVILVFGGDYLCIFRIGFALKSGLSLRETTLDFQDITGRRFAAVERIEATLLT